MDKSIKAKFTVKDGSRRILSPDEVCKKLDLFPRLVEALEAGMTHVDDNEWRLGVERLLKESRGTR